MLENSSGGTKGTLLAALDACVTASGRRLLRDWLTRPLTVVKVRVNPGVCFGVGWG